jgi:hypothetical protein
MWKAKQGPRLCMHAGVLMEKAAEQIFFAQKQKAENNQNEALAIQKDKRMVSTVWIC